jgi:hypothetical protein
MNIPELLEIIKKTESPLKRQLFGNRYFTVNLMADGKRGS